MLRKGKVPSCSQHDSVYDYSRFLSIIILIPHKPYIKREMLESSASCALDQIQIVSSLLHKIRYN